MTPSHLFAMWKDLAPGLANHLWQSTLFAVVAGALALLLRKEHARVRYGLWLATSVKFLLPFSLLVAIGSRLAPARAASGAQAAFYVTIEEISQPFQPSVAPATSGAAHATPATVIPAVMQHLPSIALGIWFCGFLAVLALWCIRWRRISTALRDASPLLEGPEVDALRRIERLAGTTRPLDVVLSETSLEPGVFGITRPVLIWPEGISEHLSAEHLDAVLAHELWHVRRRDNLAAALHMFVEALFWFHPLVWWLGTRLVEERERACDEEVVAWGSERHVYAESILKVCEFCVGSPLACVSGVTGADLKRRMVYIMTDRIARKLNFTRKLLLSTAGVLALALPIIFGAANATQIRAQAQDSSANIVASIKPSQPPAPSNGPVLRSDMKMMFSPTGFQAQSVPLKELIMEAYGVQANQLVGAPEWISKTKFDVELKGVPTNPSKSEVENLDANVNPMRLQLQAMLAQRFHLTFHHESRDLESYALIIGETGAKLQPTKSSDAQTAANGSDGQRLSARRAMFHVTDAAAGDHVMALGTVDGSTAELAALLSRQLGTPIVDKTGLTGRYDFQLQWSANGSDAGSSADAVPGSIFTAVEQQLGLKLEPLQAPSGVLVIDHVETLRPE